MLRITRLSLAVAASTALGAGIAAAQTVTYQQPVYTTTPNVVYAAPVRTYTYVTQTPTTIQQPKPEATAVPDTVVTEQATQVTEQTYVAPPATAIVQPQAVVTGQPVVTEQYVVPQTRIVVRPTNCGTYHYWNGTACVDAREVQTAQVID